VLVIDSPADEFVEELKNDRKLGRKETDLEPV